MLCIDVIAYALIGASSCAGQRFAGTCKDACDHVRGMWATMHTN